MTASRHDRRVELLYAMLVLAVCAVTWLLNAQSRTYNRDSYNRCMDRTHNIDKSNRFYQAMAELESTNRVALYRGEVLRQPRCGTKP